MLEYSSSVVRDGKCDIGTEIGDVMIFSSVLIDTMMLRDTIL